ncbi:carbohydrate ABC transporter permease [Bacillota bacterium Meth-B3]|nr:carbohydrate ABC transporter permease [Christensenellaceae bacterium]MEA5065601.1 carbohydrate ABC transporter permease [Eubacteriales bacterium]MEA5070187.1 carbohydrate ABC transporter permease [Christensenellaceae bacterium]
MASALKRPTAIRHRWSPGMIVAASLLSLYFVMVLYPLVWMVLSSLKTEREFFRNLWGLPAAAQWQNYVKAWNAGISGYFLNSVLVTASTIVLCVSIAALASYGLVSYRFRGNSLVFLMGMGGMMLAPQVTLIPLYKIIQALGIHDTYWAMILPYAAYRMPITLMLVRSYFLCLPKELRESATIDGCTSMQVLTRIYLPISKPILLTCAILVAYYAWNEFLFSIIFIDSRAYKTIPSGLMVFRDALNTDFALLFAGLTISAVPLVLVFIAMQKQFIRGMTAGAVKG